MVKICEICGEENKNSAKFCNNCGINFDELEYEIIGNNSFKNLQLNYTIWNSIDRTCEICGRSLKKKYFLKNENGNYSVICKSCIDKRILANYLDYILNFLNPNETYDKNEFFSYHPEIDEQIFDELKEKELLKILLITNKFCINEENAKNFLKKYKIDEKSIKPDIQIVKTQYPKINPEFEQLPKEYQSEDIKLEEEINENQEDSLINVFDLKFFKHKTRYDHYKINCKITLNKNIEYLNIDGLFFDEENVIIHKGLVWRNENLKMGQTIKAKDDIYFPGDKPVKVELEYYVDFNDIPVYSIVKYLDK